MVDRERRDRFQYSKYVREGYITTTPGNETDYDFIRKFIEDFAKKYNVRRIAIDRWNSTQLSHQLTGAGLEMVAWPQGFAGMNAPCRQLENMLANGKLRHGNNPVLAWQANNVSVKENAEGHIRLIKPKPNSSERVDGMVSLAMALGAWASEKQAPPRPEPSIHFI